MEKNNWKGWLYLLPASVFLGLFLVYPHCRCIITSINSLYILIFLLNVHARLLFFLLLFLILRCGRRTSSTKTVYLGRLKFFPVS